MTLSILFGSFLKFDFLIFLVAAANGVVFYLARKRIRTLYDTMHRTIYAPSAEKEARSAKLEVDGMSEQQVDAMREAAARSYTLYGTITGIFPLLGILGTVVSLLSMVGDSANVQNGFFSALTSTFWGLIFAIVYKVLDGFLSPKLEDGERSAELLMQRRTRGKDEERP
jgi:chemotaxis protein MotA